MAQKYTKRKKKVYICDLIFNISQMKKIIFYTFFCLIAISALRAQNDIFVSTTPSYKNVILEEFTGVQCINCPDGHRVASQISEENPGRIFIFNIHAGIFAANTYTTDEGSVLQTQFGVDAFPKATVNRHSFSGFPDSFLLTRGYWSAAADTILSQPSPVNIAARGTLDWSTRELSITVQLYYTASAADSTNMLNVAILQNNVIGEQDGYYYNPEQVVGNRYRHMHMLRKLITGQWGDIIDTTVAGTFVERTYNYTIPETLGTPNAISAKLEDLTFIAFISQGQREILTGCEVEMEYVNLPAIGARLKEISPESIIDCTDNATVSAKVKNIGAETITDLTFEYSVNDGETMYYPWSGQIASLATMEIPLPNFAVIPNVNQTVSARITNANGLTFDGEEYSNSLKKHMATVNDQLTLRIKTDNHANELSYILYNSLNEVIQQSSPGDFTNNTVCEFQISLPEDGCYHLEVNDAGGDGITSGYVRLYNASDQIILNATGNSFSSTLHGMISFGTVDINEWTSDNISYIYPNPASETIHIHTDEDLQTIEIYNLQGQRVAAKSGNAHHISVANLAKGVYILKATSAKGVNTHIFNKL